MKETLFLNYGLDVVGIIKISPLVYKIKTSDTQYYVKIVENRNLLKIYEYIDILHLDCFVRIYYNNNNELLTKYNDSFLYVMECLDNNQSILKELKLKFYFETLAYLHNQSFYYTKINQDYFETLKNDILLIIEERELYYSHMIDQYEKIIYRSPSQWMLVLNYYRLYEALILAKKYLNLYIDKTKDFHQIRVCLTYKHFDYNHISLKEKRLLSLESISIDLPIYDLFDMYQKIPDFLFDIDCFSVHYFKKIELLEEEKLLLCCLMNIVPIIYYEDDEIENIIKLSRLLYYLDSINAFISQFSLTL